jgi:hypothetical protein
MCADGEEIISGGRIIETSPPVRFTIMYHIKNYINKSIKSIKMLE